jgi:hypothetical protein
MSFRHDAAVPELEGDEILVGVDQLAHRAPADPQHVLDFLERKYFHLASYAHVVLSVRSQIDMGHKGMVLDKRAAVKPR